MQRIGERNHVQRFGGAVDSQPPGTLTTLPETLIELHSGPERYCIHERARRLNASVYGSCSLDRTNGGPYAGCDRNAGCCEECERDDHLEQCDPPARRGTARAHTSGRVATT